MQIGWHNIPFKQNGIQKPYNVVERVSDKIQYAFMIKNVVQKEHIST